jgi:hypothetical protein
MRRAGSGLASLHKEKALGDLALLSNYLSDPKSNGQIEAPRYESDFIKLVAQMRKACGLRKVLSSLP